MEKLVIATWKWRPPPGDRRDPQASHVNHLRAQVDRHYPFPHEFVCITDDPAGIDGDIRIVPVWDDHHELKGPNGVNCYRRLKIYDESAADILGPWFVSLDLDWLFVDALAPLWHRPEDFVICGDTARNTPYNGAMTMMRAGCRSKVWHEFDPATSPARAKALGYIGSDQAWIGACLGPGEAKWSPEKDGVYSWRVHLQNGRAPLPANLRAINFHGKEDPWTPEVQERCPWIREHYRI
jgi:hypothetical protein